MRHNPRLAAKRADALIARLGAVESIQERIDLVAADFKAKKNRYASVDAWSLGELLGIDFETSGDSGRTYWGYRAKLEDGGYDFPYAENVEYLEHLVSPKRFSELLQRAERVIQQAKPPRHDLRLSKHEAPCNILGPQENQPALPVRAWVRSAWLRPVGLYLVLGLPLLLLGILGQVVNPFPIDFWFWTREYLFVRSGPGSGYTPIAVPAFFYALIHAPVQASGFGLEAEFRIAAAVQSVLQYMTGGCILLSCLALGRPWLGLLVSLGSLIFFQALHLSQSFWSEATVTPLTGALTYAAVRLYVTPPENMRATTMSAIVAGIGTGLIAITRAVPAVFLPAFLFLAARRLPRKSAALYWTVTLCLFFSIVLAQMTANQYRFDKFVLSDSGGLHLWDAVSPIANETMSDSRSYRELKSQLDSLQGKPWWEVCSELRTLHPLRQCPYDLMGRAAFEGIRSHPVAFVIHGFGKFQTLLRETPYKFGLDIHDALDSRRNPLSRTQHLPPLAPGFGWYSTLTDTYYAGLKSAKPAIATVTLWLCFWSLSATALRRFGWLADDSPRWRTLPLLVIGHSTFVLAAWLTLEWKGMTPLFWGASLVAYPTAVLAPRLFLARFAHALNTAERQSVLVGALLGVFLVGIFLTALAEMPYPRLAVIYSPVFFVLSCYAGGLLYDYFFSRRGLT